jgi:hypothetical protein
MQRWKEIRGLEYWLLIVPVLLYISLRIILASISLSAPGQTALWIALMVAPLVAFLPSYLVGLSRRGRRVPAGRLVLFFATIGLLVTMLLKMRVILFWFEHLQSQDTSLSRLIVHLFGDPGWLLPSLVSVPLLAYLLFKWRRGRAGVTPLKP